MDALSLITAVAACIVGVGGALAVLYRIPPVKRYFERLEDARRVVRRNDMRAIVEPILHELSPNSGQSLRDAIDRIEGRQLDNSDQICLLTTQVRQIRSDLGYGDGFA